MNSAPMSVVTAGRRCMSRHNNPYRISPKVRRAALNRVKAGQYRHSVPVAIFIHPPFCAVVAQMFRNTICYGMGDGEKGTRSGS